jgi:hypothetical protein
MPIVSGLAYYSEHHIAVYTVTGVILPSCKAAAPDVIHMIHIFLGNRL